MASNGVILLNLNNRNAADFQRLEVPEAYEKASGALTAGTYVTVYKWLYEGFMMAPSLCDAVDSDGHINLVDRTNGGILEVYPDDTITISATPEPGPDPDPYPIEILKVVLKEPQTVGSSESRISWESYIAGDDGSEHDITWTNINIDPTEDSSVISISGWGALQWKYTSIYASRQLFFTPAYNMGLLSRVYDETGSAQKSAGMIEANKSYVIIEITSQGTQQSKIGIFYKL